MTISQTRLTPPARGFTETEFANRCSAAQQVMAEQNLDMKMFARMEAMIGSMTPRERRNPELIQGSRKRRITRGSGTEVQDLNRLLKQHKQMQKMMKKMKGGGMEKMMRGLGGMMPPGGPGAMPPR